MDGRIYSIQLLRFFAAAIVIFHHMRTQATFFDGHYSFLWFTRGYIGVDVFFVISGFIMVYITRGTTLTPWNFFLRRLLRVWPLYLIFSLLAGFLVFNFRAYYYGGADIGYIAKSIFFIPAPRPMDGQVWPIVGPGWTLNMEVVFFAIFAGAMLFRNNTVAASLILVLVYLASAAFGDPKGWSGFYAKHGGVMLEFVIGIAIAEFYLRGGRISVAAATGLLAVGLFFVLRQQTITDSRLLASGLPGALIVIGFLYMPMPGSPLAQRIIDTLGHISYPMYLIHLFVIFACTTWLRSAGFGRGDIPAVLFIPAIIGATIVLATAVHFWIEKPIAARVSRPLIALLTKPRTHRQRSITSQAGAEAPAAVPSEASAGG